MGTLRPLPSRTSRNNLSAIRLRPEDSDHELVKEMNTSLLKPGFPQYKVTDAVEALKNGNHITHNQLKDLHACFQYQRWRPLNGLQLSN